MSCKKGLPCKKMVCLVKRACVVNKGLPCKNMACFVKRAFLVKKGLLVKKGGQFSLVADTN
jgi:hypothetical protein